MIPWAHPTPTHHPKPRLDRVSHFSRIHSRYQRMDGPADRTNTESPSVPTGTYAIYVMQSYNTCLMLVVQKWDECHEKLMKLYSSVQFDKLLNQDSRRLQACWKRWVIRPKLSFSDGRCQRRVVTLQMLQSSVSFVCKWCSCVLLTRCVNGSRFCL